MKFYLIYGLIICSVMTMSLKRGFSVMDLFPGSGTRGVATTHSVSHK